MNIEMSDKRCEEPHHHHAKILDESDKPDIRATGFGHDDHA